VKDGDGVWLSYRIDDTKVYSTIYNNGFGFKQTVLNPQPEGIDEDKLQKRGKEGEELSYAPNEQAPYTGWAKSIYDNGQIKDLRHFKDGKYDGLATHWYQHGQKESEANYKDGTKDGPSTYWYVNGQKAAVGNFKDGKRNGLWAGWYENGQKEGECSFKAGKLVTANTWKPNGEMCTVTNLKDGNGVIVEYNEDGTENNRAIFKDGLPN
jgi:antitoxin component YwqK of YwqJK toxin-antitoxin module